MGFSEYRCYPLNRRTGHHHPLAKRTFGQSKRARPPANSDAARYGAFGKGLRGPHEFPIPEKYVEIKEFQKKM